MGYKLSGYSVLGNCEIDERVNKIYLHNMHPKYNFRMDIRKFKNLPDKEIPEELYNLDLLDGSPPCSTFSLAGSREEAWGKEKVFREGLVAQTLDDLFFEFIGVAGKLHPKVIVAENVKGLIVGNAKGYVNEIFKQLAKSGYSAQMFLLNSAFMGVPQKRERVFVIAHRNDLQVNRLELKFNERPIPYSEIKSRYAPPIHQNTKSLWYWKQRIPSDKSVGDISRRICGKPRGFTNAIIHDGSVANTLTANGTFLRYSEPAYLSDEDMIHIQTFPEDYDFMDQSVQYVCGMSVPPIMMQRISEQIYNQWFRPLETKV